MELTPIFKLLVALGLGFLVGLQREWVKNRIAGIRTFPLITVMGVVCGMLAERHGGWILAAALVALAAFALLGKALGVTSEAAGPGMTTEVASLVMFLCGALLAADFVSEAVVTAGCLAVLLHWKEPLHSFAQGMGREDLRAVIQLALVGLVILPALPDRDFGPYKVINPRDIWLMVVLIVGISLAAYAAGRVFSARRGLLIAGLLGGLISSTATTVSFARRSRVAPATARQTAVVVLIASTVVFLRVLIELALVAPTVLAVVAPPLGVMMSGMAALAWFAFRRAGALDESPITPEAPPSELKGAIGFGLLYLLVLLGVAAAKEHFGQGGLYVVAALSGLTDMDAITLSSAQLVNAGQLSPWTCWRVVMVGALANLAFKFGLVALLGDARMRKWVGITFGLAAAIGSALVAWWP